MGGGGGGEGGGEEYKLFALSVCGLQLVRECAQAHLSYDERDREAERGETDGQRQTETGQAVCGGRLTEMKADSNNNKKPVGINGQLNKSIISVRSI